MSCGFLKAVLTLHDPDGPPFKTDSILKALTEVKRTFYFMGFISAPRFALNPVPL